MERTGHQRCATSTARAGPPFTKTLAFMRQVSTAVFVILAVTACAPETEHSVESPGTKHEWSILQVAEAKSRSSGRPTAPGAVLRIEEYDLLAVKNADGSSNIWIMLWPKSSPYYKQMPEGSYVVSREMVAEVERSGKASPTVSRVLASHVER